MLEIPLTRGYSTVIDDCDSDVTGYCWFAFGTGSRFYARHSFAKPRSHLLLHRVILERVIGRKLTSDEGADHIDGNPLNNCRDNLRLATISENNANARRRSDNQSGYKGVRWDEKTGTWRARIGLNGKRFSLGYFDTPEEAHAAYCTAARELFGEFARFE